MNDRRPNILFILSDDQGAWAMHCAGTEELYTPNLDRIAEEGVRFDDFFCVSPVCSPARASLLTGTIPSAHGVHDWLLAGNLDAKDVEGKHTPFLGGYQDETHAIPYLDGQLCYTDVLAENGYACALSGKWHLGDSMHPQHGFSKWYTIGRGGCMYMLPDVIENGEIHNEEKYVTELFTDKALEYMDELKAQDNPWYLSVHYTAPHSPWNESEHPKKWIDYYKDCDFASIPDIPDHPDMVTGPVYGTPRRRQNLVGYFAAISAMDEQIGRLLDAVPDNTIVIFAGDNGMSMGHHGVWGKGNGTYPMNMYDSAVKVPFMIQWKGHIGGGKVSRDMVSAYDVFPTLMELLGIQWSSPRTLPGKSFASLLLDVDDPDLSRGDNAIVIYDEYGPVRMIRTREWKYVHRYPNGYHELYDLIHDPNEEKNLYEDPAYADQVSAMRFRLEGWFETYVEPAMDGSVHPVHGEGQTDLVTMPGKIFY